MFVMISFFFFFNDTATTEIYTLSLHDALPIYDDSPLCVPDGLSDTVRPIAVEAMNMLVDYQGTGYAQLYLDRLKRFVGRRRSEEHTSELQSQSNLVCRLLLEKKNTTINYTPRA